MIKGPIIRAIRPSVGVSDVRWRRRGVIFFRGILCVFLMLGQNSMSQILVEPLSPLPSDATFAGGANNQVVVPVELNASEQSIGLMPAHQFISTTSTERNPPQSGGDVPPDAIYDFQDPVDLEFPYPPAGEGVLERRVGGGLAPLETITDEVALGVQHSASRSRRVLTQQGAESLAGYLGLSVQMQPYYAGSNVYQFAPRPVGHVELLKTLRWSDEDGLEFIPFADLPAGFAFGLNWRQGRQGSHVPSGIDEKSGGFELGVEFALPLSELEIFLDAEKGLFGGNLGWEIETGIRTASIDIRDSVEANASFAATWVDATAMRSGFSVSASEALASGLTAYQTDAGLRDISARFDAMYFVTDNFGFYGSATGKVLVEQAAKSPIVQDEGSPLQLSSNLGLIYRF